MNALSYAGTTKIEPANAPHLGGNIKEGDPGSFCPHVWDYVIDRFCVRSVMDLGCGVGHAAEYFFKKGLRTLAVDGLAANVRASYYPAVCHDLTAGPVITNVDLVHCQEVVEHIEERFLNNVLSSLGCGRIILMTHAVPGQGGHHHVNEKPMEYWNDHIQRMGYTLLVEDSNRVRAIAKQEGAIWMAGSGLVFHRR